MVEYNGSNLLLELKKDITIAYLKYYTQTNSLIQNLLRFHKLPIGELFLTKNNLYIFRKKRKIYFNLRRTGVVIEQCDIKNAYFSESYLHIQLAPKSYSLFKKFFKSHFLIYIKNRTEDGDVNRISFYVIDEREAQVFVKELSLGNVSKIQQQEGTLPTVLKNWLEKKNSTDAALSLLDYKILIFLYNNRGPDWSRTQISDGINENSSNIRVRIKRLHKKLGLLKGKPKGTSNNSFLYRLADFDK